MRIRFQVTVEFHGPYPSWRPNGLDVEKSVSELRQEAEKIVFRNIIPYAKDGDVKAVGSAWES